MLDLNQRAAALCRQISARQVELRIDISTCSSGATIFDFGIDAPGGLSAGRLLAEVCLAGLGEVALPPAIEEEAADVRVSVRTDHPVAACMRSQYAGWRISVGEYFAMGSGPMRAAANKEKLYAEIGGGENADAAVGVLETRQIPTPEVCRKIAADCSVAPEKLSLLVAPTASIAGGVQIVARSVETALHKMHELGFDLASVDAGFGVAPLPPVAADDVEAIGRTNDAVLYGGRVTLWVSCEDSVIESLGPQIPSCASADFGRPFAEIFAAYDRDFYKIDPHLFSPAAVAIVNLQTGKRFAFGRPRPDVLQTSFAGSSD